MSGIKKGLDKFDLGTPMLTALFGGTADYGEGRKNEERKLANLAKVRTTDERQNDRRKVKPKTLLG